MTLFISDTVLDPKSLTPSAKENYIFDTTEFHDRSIQNLFPRHSVLAGGDTFTSLRKSINVKG